MSAGSAKANISYVDSANTPALANTAKANQSAAGVDVVRSVVVTSEGLDVAFGAMGDTVTYHATLLDNLSNKLPAAFVADILMGSVFVVNGKPFNAQSYNQSTGVLTLTWIVPYPAKANLAQVGRSYTGFMAAYGGYTVKVNWMGQAP